MLPTAPSLIQYSLSYLLSSRKITAAIFGMPVIAHLLCYNGEFIVSLVIMRYRIQLKISLSQVISMDIHTMYCAYELLRYLDLQIDLTMFVLTNKTDRTDWFIPAWK
jgi:hypothetical protein